MARCARPGCRRAVLAGIGCVAHGHYEPRQAPPAPEDEGDRRPWTQTDIDYCYQHRRDMNCDEIAIALKRTKSAVKHLYGRKALEWGPKPRVRRARPRRRPVKVRRWTEDELADLEDGEWKGLLQKRSNRAVWAAATRRGVSTYTDGRLSLRQAAAALGVNPAIASRMMKAGQLRGERGGPSGRMWRIEPEEVERVKAARQWAD